MHPYDTPLSDAALAQLFTEARSISGWQRRPVDRDILVAIYDMMKMGPTSANSSPARFTFVTSPAGKRRLASHASAGNQEKILSAPATVIIAYDLAFATRLPQLFPHEPDAASWFSDPDVAEETAFRNSCLQGAYLMLAARAMGLDCGPMSGFDKAGVDAEFFAGTDVRSNFICGLGYGDPDGLFARHPRLSFDEAAQCL